jgi:hypothetical protein
MIGKISALLLSVAFGCEVAQGFAAQKMKADPIVFSHDIGLFAANRQGRFCLSIKNVELKRGQEMTLIWVSAEEVSSRPEIRYAKIQAKLAAPCDPANHTDGDATYELVVDKFEIGRVYFAVVGRHSDLRITRDRVTGRLGATDEIAFRSCASMEGLHFLVSAGNGSNAKKVWHDYYYLGYDVEPNCKEADFKD